MYGYYILQDQNPALLERQRQRNEARAAAFYAAARPLRSGLAAGVRLIGWSVEVLRRWRLQRQVVHDLSVLNDRVLRDIGIARRDIRAIARSYAHKPRRHVTAAELAPAESAPLSKPRVSAQAARPRLAAIEGGRRETERRQPPAVRPAAPAAQQQALAGCG